MDVLLVEDEQLVRELVEEELEYAGLSVVSVGSAEEGLNRINGECGAAVVVTDVNLPGMDGLELASEVEKRWPSVPVFIMTGDDRNLARLPSHLSGKCFLKPFSPQLLANAVASTLSSASET